MNAHRWVLVVAFIVAGCATIDRYRGSELRPGRDPGHWVFTATAPPAFPAASAEAERTRMAWLRASMDDAEACPGSWKITSRRVFPHRVVLDRATDRIVYEVECLRAT
jgi:hypothetical protein